MVLFEIDCLLNFTEIKKIMLKTYWLSIIFMFLF